METGWGKGYCCPEKRVTPPYYLPLHHVFLQIIGGCYPFFRATISFTPTSFHTSERSSRTITSGGSLWLWPRAESTWDERRFFAIISTNCSRTFLFCAGSFTSSSTPCRLTKVKVERSGAYSSISTETFGFAAKYSIFLPYLVERK